MTLTPSNLEFEQIKVGDVFAFKKVVDNELVDRFADLVGDFNPLHMDTAYARKNGFKDRLAHGMLVSGFFSTLVGMLCPGERALYLSQNLNFKKPIILGGKVLIKGEVLDKFESTGIIKLKTTIYDQKDKIAVEGEALVKVRPRVK